MKVESGIIAINDMENICHVYRVRMLVFSFLSTS